MWTIHPLDLGTLTVTKGAQAYKHGVRHGVGETVDVPCIAWLLSGSDGTRILVDSGPSEDLEWGSRHHNPIRRTDKQLLRNALAVLGVKPDQISRCVLTHLHWDHAYGALELPNAEIIVQSEELKYAIDPLPVERGYYETEVGDRKPFFLEFFAQIKTIRGEYGLAPGLTVVPLPGHTPGMQGVLAETAGGRFLLAGDLVNCLENWTERIPPGIYYSLEACYASFQIIEGLNAAVLPSHDLRAFAMLGK